MNTRTEHAVADETTSGLPMRVHYGILIVLQVTMAVELILVFNETQWTITNLLRNLSTKSYS